MGSRRACIAAAAVATLAGCAGPGWKDATADVALELPPAVQQEVSTKIAPRGPAAPVRLEVVSDLQRTSMGLADDIHEEADEVHAWRADGLLETTRVNRASNARSRTQGRAQQVSVCGLLPLLTQTSTSTASEGTTAAPVGKTFIPLGFNSGFDTGTRFRVTSLQLPDAACAPRPGSRFSASFDTELQFKFAGSMVKRNQLLTRAERLDCETASALAPASTIVASVPGDALRVSCHQTRRIKDEPDAKTPDLAFERVFLRDWGFYVAAPATGKDGRTGVRYRLLP